MVMWSEFWEQRKMIRSAREAEYALQKTLDELESRVKERTAAEREQRNLAEELRETSSILSSTLNLDEVLDRILIAIGRVVPHETTNIILVDGAEAHVVRSRDQAGKYGISQNSGGHFPLNDFPNLEYMAENQQPLIISETREIHIGFKNKKHYGFAHILVLTNSKRRKSHWFH